MTASECVKRISWGYPSKSCDKVKRKLKKDLKFYGTGGRGDCALLDLRHPEIVTKTRKNGTIWYQVEVDDIPLPLAYDEPQVFRLAEMI